MLGWKINKLISSGGMHGWRVGDVVYRQGRCCTFGWTRKSPWQHTGEGYDGADGYPLLSSLVLARQTMLQVWQDVQAGSRPSPRCPPPSLSPQSLSAILSQLNLFLLLILPYFPFTFFLSIHSPICLTQAKDQLATFTGQVRGSQLQPRRKLTYLLAWGACPGGCSSR